MLWSKLPLAHYFAYVYAGVPLLFAAAVIAMMTAAQRRVAQQRSLLSMLALATEKGIPLPDSIDAFARDQGGRFAHRARVLAQDLRSGMPFDIAVRRNAGVLPRGAELAARVGYDCGKLGPALSDQVAGYRVAGGLRQVALARIPYVGMVLLTAPFIVMFMIGRIMPSFEQIFNDFDLALPPLTLWVFRAFHHPIAQLGGPLLFVLVLAVACACVLWHIGWLSALPPGVDRLFARFDRARILRALSYPAELRQPLAPLIARLGADFPRGLSRRRLQRAAATISAGGPWIASLEKERLIGRVEAAVLESAERAGNLHWALREMADSNERRLLYRLAIWLQLGSVFMVGAFGLGVLIFVVAFFLPLTKLIWSLSL